MIKTDLKLYSVRDVAQMFRVVPSRIRTLIGHGRIPDARYVGSSWAIPEGSEVLPDPETKFSPAQMYAKLGGNITKYIALCEERGVPARIPPYEWFEPEPPWSHRKLTAEDVTMIRLAHEMEGTSYSQLAKLYEVHRNTVHKALAREARREPKPCLICSGSGQLIAENEQFGDLAFPCRECSGRGFLGEAPRE